MKRRNGSPFFSYFSAKFQTSINFQHIPIKQQFERNKWYEKKDFMGKSEQEF